MTTATHIVVLMVRVWTRVYTFGLPEDNRVRREQEIESDLWESLNDEHAPVRPWALLARLIIGVPDDLRLARRAAASGASADVRVGIRGRMHADADGSYGLGGNCIVPPEAGATRAAAIGSTAATATAPASSTAAP